MNEWFMLQNKTKKKYTNWIMHQDNKNEIGMLIKMLWTKKFEILALRDKCSLSSARDSHVYSSIFNMTCRIKQMKCRAFNSKRQKMNDFYSISFIYIRMLCSLNYSHKESIYQFAILFRIYMFESMAHLLRTQHIGVRHDFCSIPILSDNVTHCGSIDVLVYLLRTISKWFSFWC